MKFLELRVYPDSANKRERHSIRMMAIQYILCGGWLYRRSYDGIHLRCLMKEEPEKVIEEIHQGIYGPHMNGRMLAKKILRVGVLLEHDGDRLCRLCEELPQLPNICKPESRAT